MLGIGQRSAIETGCSYKWLRGTTTRSLGADSGAAADRRASTVARKVTWPETARSPSPVVLEAHVPATTAASPATSPATARMSGSRGMLLVVVAVSATTATRKDTLPVTVRKPDKSVVEVVVEEASATTATRKDILHETVLKPKELVAVDQVAVATATTATSLDTLRGIVHRNARKEGGREVGTK